MKELQEIIQTKEALLIDVRSPWEFEEGHLAGALNIPLEDIPGQTAVIEEARQPVIVYCRSGNRSAMAVRLLQQQGLTDIYNGGGMADLQHLLN